ncbi:MAG: Asp-tRNA(Asn)/Glu-tRNA(Gln) amidotransferase subunit GatB [Planctomycetota bacterium]|nr:Asp-tRNA(Asn)/Glu-tRNA(Gln) amidotransferase subunit GatB [Planctomycetota bacterium]
MATAAPPRHDFTTRLMVGLEIHVELATRTKMFTAAPNVAHPDYADAEPNTLCDPVVLGMPGVLPVLNRRAIEMSVLAGLALGCKIARDTKWDRKSYYYPDLPKNYQISQYDQPLCHDGAVEIPDETPGAAPGATKNIRIIRAHLEEDAGKLLHESPGGYAIDHSIVDLNRAGTPLLEIVTHPDFDSPEQVVTFCQTLRNIVRFLGITQGIMQRGHIRFEPNINVVIERGGQTFKTPIVEIKNLNSFKAVHGAIVFEYERQVQDWLDTGVVMKSGSKSTRGWDDGSESTFLQREKEEAHDYRYFPDPDLVHVTIDDAFLERMRAQLPELPLQRQKRYEQTLGLSAKDAATLVDESKVAAFFEAILALGGDAKRAAVLLLNNLARRANEKGLRIDQLGVTPAQVKQVLDLVAGNKVGSAAADDLLGFCCEDPAADAAKLAEAKGLLQVSDEGALDAWVEQAMAANPKSVEAVRGGKEAAITSLVGAVMKLSRGKANAKVVQEKLRAKLLG